MRDSKPLQKDVFLREATGLVRGGGTLSAFAFNWIFTGNAIGIIGAFLLFGYPVVSPGSNWLLLVVLAGLTGAVVSLTYGFLSIIMPRAGGDYIYIGRTLHPSLGFMASMGWAAWLPIVFGWAGKNVGPIAIQTALSTWGVLTGNSNFTNAANSLSDPNVLFIIGTVTIGLFGLLALVPVKAYFKIQNVAFVLMLITFAITIIVFATNTPQSFAAATDRLTGTNTYETLVKMAKAPGFIPPNNLEANLAGWAEWTGFAIFAMGTAFMGSEIKNVKKSQTFGTLVSVLLLTGAFFATLLVFMNAVGTNFMYAISYTYGTNAYTLPIPPYYSSFVILLARNPVVVLLFTIGFVLGGVWFMGQNVMLTARIILAWSFDRVVPASFGTVSGRFRTPIWGLITALVVGEVALVIYVYTNWLGLFSQLLALAIAMTFGAITAIVFPFKKRSLFESSGAAYRIGRIPVLTLLGIGSVVTLLIFIYINVIDSSLGSNNPVSLYLITIVYAIGFVGYFVSKVIRKSQGIDLSLSFKELPPE